MLWLTSKVNIQMEVAGFLEALGQKANTRNKVREPVMDSRGM